MYHRVNLIKKWFKINYFDSCFLQRLCGNELLEFNNSIFLTEKSSVDRDFSLAYFMRENNCFPKGADIKKILEFYFQVKHCHQYFVFVFKVKVAWVPQLMKRSHNQEVVVQTPHFFQAPVIWIRAHKTIVEANLALLHTLQSCKWEGRLWGRLPYKI